MEELKQWVEYNIFHTKKKIETMKRVSPQEPNITWFDGQLISYEKILNKITELNRKTNDKR
jgi:hypothetical protein